MFIFELVTLADRHAWQFVESFTSGNRTPDDPIPIKGGDLTEPSQKVLLSLYCFREVLRDVAIVSIDCFWVEEEKSSLPDPIMITRFSHHKLVRIVLLNSPEYSEDSCWP